MRFRDLAAGTCVALSAFFGGAEGQGKDGEPEAPAHARVFRAGADSLDISPTKLPVIVSGMFEERTASRVEDPLHARCLVLDDGTTRLALVFVDSLMMPRELIDRVKAL